MSNYILRQNEKIIKAIHPHWIVFLWLIVLSVVLLLAGFFFLYPLFKMGNWGVALFVVIIFLGVILAIRTFVAWHFSELLITNQRIINITQRGLFNRQALEIEYSNIINVSSQIKGVFKTIFHYGNVMVQVSLTKKVVILNIPKPESIQGLITQLCQEQKKGRDEIKAKLLTAEEIIDNTSMQDLIKVVKKLKNTIGGENLQKIIDESDNDV